MTKLARLLCVAGTLILSGVGQASAGLIGTQGFFTDGNPTVDTGIISTATIFSSNWKTNNSQSGIFAAFPNYNFSNIVFDKNVGTSFVITDAGFGTFASTSITQSASGNDFANFDIVGNFTQGTNPSASGPALFSVGFTQTPAEFGGAISASGTLAVYSAVPEPSTLALIGLGSCGLIVSVYRRNRKSAV